MKAVVSYEPGTEFIFLENEMPSVATPANDAANISLSQPISTERFALLTQMPIIIYYGDYISAENPHWASQRWIERIRMAQAFADCVNRHGGDASVVQLPDIGIRGNSHFAFIEANNVEIADVLESWLEEKGLK